MPKYTSHLFQGVQKKQVNKSTFDLSHEWKHDLQLGTYVPFLMIPTLPGDEFEIECEFFFKFDPLYYPIIHRCNLDADLFWIPNRIMWPATVGDDQTGWTNWIMLKNETEHPTVDVDMGYLSVPSFAANKSVYGYLGVPYLFDDEVGRSTVITGLNAFPAMAYLQIWDQYYRNPQLEDERSFPLVAGDNTAAMIAAYGFETPTNIYLHAFPAKWRLDYFTSALPQPQVGDAIQIPVMSSPFPGIQNANPDQPWRIIGTGAEAAVGETLETQTDHSGTPTNPNVYLDVQSAAGTIRELSLYSVLQQFRETLLKIGQRYRDYVIGIFSEDPTPMDISVPVLIGNYKGVVQISEVLTQANTGVGESNFFTGDYGGNAGLYEHENHMIRFNCREHGLIMGIMNVMPNTGYGQGINRYWRYSTPYDYPMDVFSTVGDQEILKEEILYNNLIADAAKNGQTFGYIPKYSEARFINNNYGTNLANILGAGLSMHLGRWWNPDTTTGAMYDQRVELDEYFINALGSNDAGDIRISDVFRVLTLPNGETQSNVIVAYVYNKITAKRPLPLYSTPSLT